MRRREHLQFELAARFIDLFRNRPTSLVIGGNADAPDQCPLAFPVANENVTKQHNVSYASDAPKILSIPNAVVSGRSTIGSKESVYCIGQVHVPAYVENFLRDGLAPADTIAMPEAERFISGASVLLTHWNSSIYGHWLTEGLPKLLLLKRLLPDIRSDMQILAPSEPAILSFVTRWRDAVAPEIPLVTYDVEREHVRCEFLLLPDWLGGKFHQYHPILNDLLETVIASCGGASHERVYISREKEPLYREFANKDQIESIAKSFGYRIFIPEHHSVAEQISTFASAREIAGPFGSSLHNTLFSPKGARVVSLNWINAIQSRIAQVRGHDIGYILPEGGEAVAYERSLPRRRCYEISPHAFRCAIERAHAI